MPNQLATESSPYLLQHVDNPVDWSPWDDAAFERARAEDKPIFLSIGYSACHWCHVMAHESFEDPAIAAVLNRHFVSIKVDREERPDIDGIYMQAVVALTGQGGWPLSVFLTPAGVPFWGGTYFPPTAQQGLPSFRQVLDSLADAYETGREDVIDSAVRIAAILRAAAAPKPDAAGEPSHFLLNTARQRLVTAVDPENGGWGGAPKFPQPMALDFLLRYYHRTRDASALEVADSTLRHMAAGGIHDQLGGGFHRYTVDAIWLVPHFEKMLYDNSQLARVYLKAWQITGAGEHRRTAESILDFVARDMTAPDGGFYSTLDADTDGEEGLTYVWSATEIEEALGGDAAHFSHAYGVTPGGNFEGRSILHRTVPAEAVAEAAGLDLDESERRLAAARARLLELRSRRPQPGRDEKVITAWNGLMLAAFADAGRFLQRDDYLQVARRNADFLLSELVTPERRVFRTFKDGRARLNGYVEDYSHTVEGLLSLYEATFDEAYFVAARELADQMVAHFADPNGGFYETSDDHEELITRPHSLRDNATPSGGAVAATVLLRLASLTGESAYREGALAAVGRIATAIEPHPTAYAQWLVALEYHFSNAHEIAIIGDLESPATRALLDVVNRGLRPAQVLAAGPPVDITPVPLLRGRGTVGGAPTAYVCRDFVCDLPIVDPEALAARLNP
ncbi:MAG: thioredoxin domain-containing protein [Chloroflexota bacterium]|nr:thioredoxin domain-containing protein [Chloroflexota bacterium]